MVVRSHEGREPVAPARVERTGACGRGEQATHPGGVGAPPGGQYGLPARSWLTEAVHVFGRSRKARPDAQGERRRAPRLLKEGVHISDCRATWRAVPSLLQKGRQLRKTRAQPRRENDGACPKQRSVPEMTNEMPQGKTMNETDDATLSAEQSERLHTAIHRMRANFLRFWILCGKAGCRKARKCSADPDICMSQLGPDVPDDVRNAADELLFGTCAGLPFDEVAAKAPRQLSAYCRWLEKVKEEARLPHREKKARAAQKRQPAQEEALENRL